ncbi:MAG: hypothetical protein ACO1QB_06695 [Verrucomicrobiales bacterium]
MKLNWKVLRVAILLSGVAFGSGCGGISASHGVSPASLLLPGLVHKAPAEHQEKAATPVAMAQPVSSSVLN